MARFKLVPLEQKSAMEQLFDCARMATTVIMRSHGWFGLYRDYRDEVYDDIVFETVRHFIEHKVKRHTYCRQTKEGKPLAFADNVLSSCFGVASRVVDVFLKNLTRLNETADIEPMKFCLSYADKLPIYVNNQEYKRRWYKRRLTRGTDRAKVARREYEDYLAEFHELGLSGEPLEIGPWLVRNGYGSDDELFLYMETKEERRKLLQGQARWIFEKKQAERDALIPDDSVRQAVIRNRDYQREYARKRREKEREEVDRKLREVLGAPPDGYQWFEMKDGRVGQRRLKK